jgi:hypothetical protein
MSASGREVDVAAHSILSAIPVKQPDVFIVGIYKLCPQAKETRLPKDPRVWRVRPMGVKEQIA